jgi:hypothetical protein
MHMSKTFQTLANESAFAAQSVVEPEACAAINEKMVIFTGITCDNAGSRDFRGDHPFCKSQGPEPPAASWAVPFGGR